VGLEPAKAHGQPVLDGPHVSVLARDGYPATPTRPCVASKYDDFIITCIDEALDLKLEVLVRSVRASCRPRAISGQRRS
jgi:hypothetical protein